MMKRYRCLLPQLALAAALVAATPETIPGQAAALEIDPAQTKVDFTVSSALHTVHGEFTLKRGNIRFDPATGKVSGELVVDAGSGNSGSGARDKRMNNTVLETAKYPEIVFRPDRVEGKVAVQGASQVQLHGMFLIHGAEHELTVPVTVETSGSQYHATATFTVPYIQWGMKNPSTLFLRVSDHVDITVHTVARPPHL